MLVLCPYYSGDSAQAERVYRFAAAQAGGHEIRRMRCGDDGVVEDWALPARPFAGPATCAWMICGAARRLDPGQVFFWLEPDCCLTRRTSLSEIEAAFAAALAANPELCLLGHDKREQWDKMAFISGVAVYRTTPTLLGAMDGLTKKKPHDQELAATLLNTPAAADTPLIRCVWNYTREAYLAGFEGKPEKVLAMYRDSAAVIHGDKDGEMSRLVWEAEWS